MTIKLSIIILSYGEKHILPLHNLTLRSHLTGHDERVPKWRLFLYLMDQFWRMHDLRMLHSIYNQHEDRWWPGQLDWHLQSDIKYNLKHIFNKAFYNLKKILLGPTVLQITTRHSRLTLADAAWSHPSNSLDNDFPLLVYQLPACVARRVVISLILRWLLVLSRNIGMKSSFYCIHARGLSILIWKVFYTSIVSI